MYAYIDVVDRAVGYIAVVVDLFDFIVTNKEVNRRQKVTLDFKLPAARIHNELIPNTRDLAHRRRPRNSTNSK